MPQKFEKISHLFWSYWVETAVLSKQTRYFFQILWPSHNVFTLHSFVNVPEARWTIFDRDPLHFYPEARVIWFLTTKPDNRIVLQVLCWSCSWNSAVCHFSNLIFLMIKIVCLQFFLFFHFLSFLLGPEWQTDKMQSLEIRRLDNRRFNSQNKS